MKKLTDVSPEFNQETDMEEKMIYWWALRFVSCGLDASFDEIMSKDHKSKQARDNNWNKFAKLNGFNLIKGNK